MAKPISPQRGDLVKVSIVDPAEDPTGNPDEAELCASGRVGIYWGETESFGVKCVVLTQTHDEDDHSQQGYWIHPMPCVTGIKRLKKNATRTQ